MKPAFLLLLLTFFSLQSFSQQPFNDLVLKIDKDLEVSSDKFPRESIQLLTDRQECFAGANFLLSCFLNINGHPSNLSRTIYVELGDYEGNIIEKKMLAIEKGGASAIMTIPTTVQSGTYVINAYSLWMKNTPELIAQKQILIIAPDYVNKPFVLRNNEAPISSVVFQPEGHSWVDNSEQNFILQLLDKNNTPVSKPFSIVENGKEIKSGKTDLNGLSQLALTLKKGNAYQLKSGSQEFKLDPGTEGIALSFNNSNKTRLFVNLQKSQATKGNQYLLVAIDDEKLCYQSIFNFAEGTTGTAITKSKLPSGLLNFLLFDEDQNIVAQRYFYNYVDFAPIDSRVIDSNLIIRPDTNATKNSIVSVTVAPAHYIFDYPNNYISLVPILQNKYAVQIPDFSPASLQTIDQMFCLLSSGHAGQKWKINEPALKYPLESGITVRGFIKPYAGNANPNGYKAVLVVKGEDSTTTYSTVQTQANGDFTIGDLSFQNAARIYFQGNNSANQKELLNSQLYPSYVDTLKHLSAQPYIKFEKQYANTATTAELQKNMSEFMSMSGLYKQMETVVVKAKKKAPMDSLKQVYLTPLYTDGNSIYLEPNGNYINFWHFLRGKVPGLRVDGNLDNPNVYFSRYGGTIPTTNNTGEDLGESYDEGGLMFFLNEVPVSRDVVGTINPNDVALVVANREPMAVLGAYNGMIAIYTKKGVPMGGGVSKAMTMERRTGYSNLDWVFKWPEDNITPGATIYFGPMKKNYTVPSKFKYNMVLAGWNAKGEFVFYSR